MSKITTPSGIEVEFIGPPKGEGPLPAFIYFSLSGHASLHQDPYNQPIVALHGEKIRSFSWDLPYHPKGGDPHKGIAKWVEDLENGIDPITPFIEQSKAVLHELINLGWIDKKLIAVGGLSRGGFVATHLAAVCKEIHHLVAFAPMTNVLSLELKKGPPFDELNLTNLAAELLHKNIRFYIGNHDERVKTDYCYAFIRTLAELSFVKRTREHNFELRIAPSIGYKGHGTAKELFIEGAHWVKEALL
jgi:esterase FrsA